MGIFNILQTSINEMTELFKFWSTHLGQLCPVEEGKILETDFFLFFHNFCPLGHCNPKVQCMWQWWGQWWGQCCGTWRCILRRKYSNCKHITAQTQVSAARGVATPSLQGNWIEIMSFFERWMFYLSVCEECWRGGSAVTGVVFHQGRAGGAISRCADAREQCWPRPRAPPPSSCCISSPDNFPPSAGIFWSHVIPLQRAAAGRFCFEVRLSK